jgi:hypothetical protein
MPQYAASQLACLREPETSHDPYPAVLRHGRVAGRTMSPLTASR